MQTDNSRLVSKVVKVRGSRLHLLKIAKRQRITIFFIGVMILLGLTTAGLVAASIYNESDPNPILRIIVMSSLVLNLAAGVFSGLLGRAAGHSIFLAILMGLVVAFGSLFGLMCLILLNQRATGILQGNGVHVGLFGVSSDDFPLLAES